MTNESARTRRPARAAMGILTAALLAATPVSAQDATTTPTTDLPAIPSFQINSMDPLPDTIDFADQFESGVSTFDIEHQTNLAQCKAYNLETSDVSSGLAQVEGALEADAGTTDARTDDTATGTDAGTDNTDDGTCTLESTQPVITVSWSGDTTELTGTQWKAWVGTCTKTDTFDGDPGTSCYQLTDEAQTFSSGNNEFDLPLGFVIGTQPISDPNALEDRKCCSAVSSGVDGNTVNVWIQTSGAASSIVSLWEKVVFRYDYVAPGAPGSVSVNDAGETVKVSWSKPSNTNEDTTDYQVYWSGEPFSTRVAGLGSKSVSGTLTSTTIEGLLVGETYYIAVGAIDEFDNESPLSATVTATPVETLDGFESYKAAGGGEEGGFCFVATAAYGSYMDPHVQILRNFRDAWLLTNAPGRAFVRFYYREGPAWAAVVRESEPLRVAAQVALMPLVLLAGFLVELTIMQKLMVLLTLWLARRLVKDMLRKLYWAPAMPGARRS